MKTFIPAHDFTGYPLGRRVEFKEGVEAGPYSEEFVSLVVGKGHAKGAPKEPKPGSKRPAAEEPVNGDGRSVADIEPPADPTLPADTQA